MSFPPTKDYTRIPNEVIHDPNLTDHEFRVWCHIAFYHRDNGEENFRSLATIARELDGRDKRTILRAVQSLEAKGYVIVQRRGQRKTSLYRATAPVSPRQESVDSNDNSLNKVTVDSNDYNLLSTLSPYKDKTKREVTKLHDRRTPATKLLSDFSAAYSATMSHDYISERKPDLRRARALLKKHPINIIYTSLDLYFRDKDIRIKALPSFASFHFHTERYAKSHYQEINDNVMSLEAKRNVR